MFNGMCDSHHRERVLTNYYEYCVVDFASLFPFKAEDKHSWNLSVSEQEAVSLAYILSFLVAKFMNEWMKS